MHIPLELKSSEVQANYEPSIEDRDRISMQPEHFTLSGDGVFHVIQGEGITMGRPATFVRLQFCNLACTWCDAWYTWRKDREEYYKEPFHVAIEDLRALIEKEQQEKGVQEMVKRVVFTGGEPMMQADKIEEFMKLNPDFIVEIETNGTIMPTQFLLKNVQWNCSPKTSSSGNSESSRKKVDVLSGLAKQNATFKFVCTGPDDIEEILDEFAFLPREKIFIMPEGITKEQNYAVYKTINESLLKYGLSTTPRLQNIMYDAASRRV